LAALLAALLTAITLFALAGYQVTSPEPGTRLLGRLAAALVELDRWTPVHREDVQLAARDRPQESVLVDDLPVDVVLPSAAVLEADDSAMAALLRQAMGRRLYREGHSVMRDDEGANHLDITEPVRWTVSLLGSDMHGFWRVALVVTGAATLGLLVIIVTSGRSPFPPLVAGALLGAAGALCVWLIAGVAGRTFDGAIDRETALILQDGAWLGLRNSVAASVIALGLLYLWRTLIEPRQNRGQETYWPDFEGSDAYRGDPN
jgi:hypothetical protein